MILISLATAMPIHHNVSYNNKIFVAISKISLDRYFSGKTRRILLNIRPLKGKGLCIFKDIISRFPSTVYAVEFERERKLIQSGYIGEQDLTEIPLDKIGLYLQIEIPYSSSEIKVRARGGNFRLSTSFTYCGTGKDIEIITPWYAVR